MYLCMYIQINFRHPPQSEVAIKMAAASGLCNDIDGWGVKDE